MLDGTVQRKDRGRVLRVLVLDRGFTLFGFSPKFSLVNDVRRSNAQGYDRKRNRAELSFVQQFQDS